MNHKMLKRGLDKLFEIDPPARGVSPYGEFHGIPLRKWQLTKEQGKFKIKDTASDHFMLLNRDNFRGFREPNVLQLKVQLTRQGNHCWQDPVGFNRISPLPGYPTSKSNYSRPSDFSQGMFLGALGIFVLMAMVNS